MKIETNVNTVEEILEAFPIGTVIESTIGLGGGTEVFIDGDILQPFSYLDDYDISHYKKTEVKETK